MKLDPKNELLALLKIEELGEATVKELVEHTGIEEKELKRYIRRLQAKKIVVANVVDGEKAYKIGDVPYIPTSDMARVKTSVATMDKEEANEILEKWTEKLSDMPKLPTLNKYRDFRKFELVFETIDPILGDRGEGKFPTNGSGAIIPSNWWKAWFRSNMYVLNIPETVAKHRLGYSVGLVGENVELETIEAMTDKGPRNYETLPVGTKIVVRVRFPMVGTPIRKEEQLKAFLEEVSEEPQRGFGANPFYYGGRMKFVAMTDLGSTASNILAK